MFILCFVLSASTLKNVIVLKRPVLLIIAIEHFEYMQNGIITNNCNLYLYISLCSRRKESKQIRKESNGIIFNVIFVYGENSKIPESDGERVTYYSRENSGRESTSSASRNIELPAMAWRHFQSP